MSFGLIRKKVYIWFDKLTELKNKNHIKFSWNLCDYRCCLEVQLYQDTDKLNSSSGAGGVQIRILEIAQVR